MTDNNVLSDIAGLLIVAAIALVCLDGPTYLVITSVICAAGLLLIAVTEKRNKGE